MSRGVLLAVAAVVGFGLVGLVAWLTLTHAPPEVAPWTAPAEHVAGAPELPSGPAHDVGASRGPPSRPAVDTLPLGAAPPTAVRDPSAEDPAGLVLFGAVVDEAGLAVDAERISVRLHGPRGYSDRQTFERPSYAFAGLAPGTWRLSASATGFRDTEVDLELAADAPLRRLDVALQRAVVLPVRVLTPAGDSLQQELTRSAGFGYGSTHLSVVATRMRPEADLPPISHRAYGHYGIGSYSSRVEAGWLGNDIPPGAHGVLQIDGALPAWVSLVARHVVLASQEVPPGAEEVVFVLSVDEVLAVQGSLRLRVLDALTGEPLTDADVGLSTSQDSGAGAEVAADGEVRFDQLPPGWLELGVSAPGRGGLQRRVDVIAGKETDLGDVLLGPAIQVSGRIVDAEGTPRSAVFQVHELGRFDEDFGISRRMYHRSGDDGAFRVRQLAHGTYVLRVHDQDWVGSQVVDTRHGDVDGVQVEVHRPTSVTLRTSWSRESHHALRVFAEGGTPLLTSLHVRGARDFTLRLAPGDYEIVVDAGDPLSLSVGSEALELVLRP